MGLLLRVEAGQDAGRTFPIPPEGGVIGRGERATILLSDGVLSRQHARIVAHEGGATITDLGSANGTRINDRPLDGTATLRPGDIIEVGSSRLRLELATDATLIEERRSVPPEVRQQETIRRADDATVVRDEAPAPEKVALGATLNRRYRLDRLAGQGGFAQVFVAYDLELERAVALKVLHANLQEAEGGKDLLERFQREARAVAALNHGNILPIWDYGQVAGSPYLVMPFIDGGSLYDRLRNGPRPDLGQIGEWLRQIAAALDYAHARNIVHRDIKPQNMLLSAEEGRLLLADFGIAKVITDAGSQNATGVIGTLSYMAPEQFRGQVGRTVDVYALGCVLFQLLTGQLPYSGSTERVIHGHLNEGVPALSGYGNPHLPATLQQVVARAMAKKPEDRFPSAGALATAYTAALAAPRESAATEVVQRPDPREERTQLADEERPRRAALDATVVGPIKLQPDPIVVDTTQNTRNGRGGGLSRRTFLLAGAASGITALACVGGVFAIAAAGGRGAATPTVGLAAAAPSATEVPPVAVTFAPTVTAFVPIAASPTATAIPPTAILVPPTATTAPTPTPLPTATATIRPTPTATLRPAAGDEVLSAWKPQTGADYNLAFDPVVGGYRITVNEVGVGRSQYAPSAASYSDFELLADCHLAGTSNAGGYGLHFHGSPAQSSNVIIGYRFQLTGNGSWALEYANADRTVSTIQASTAVTGIVNPPTATNRLTVSCKNRVITLGVNGRPVGTFNAVAPATGWIGLSASNYQNMKGIDAIFTNLRITKL